MINVETYMLRFNEEVWQRLAKFTATETNGGLREGTHACVQYPGL